MPPKKSRSPSPGKGKKKKINKEEEERLAREAEEARLQAEREEAERLERERVEAEERKRLENEEKKLRRTQLEALADIVNKNTQALQCKNDEMRKHAKWDRFMRCDGTPDPSVAGEINTYVNLWREDVRRVRVQDVLVDTRHALELIDELSFLLVDTPTDELSSNAANQYKSAIEDLERIVDEKLMIAAYYVLVDATKLADTETNNLQATVSNESVEINIWGNLSKNPRIKSFDFERVTFDIPRLLRLADCALVFIFTKFDHVSSRSWSYVPHLKPKLEPENDSEKDVDMIKDEVALDSAVVELEETKVSTVALELKSLDDSDDDMDEVTKVEVAPVEPEEIVQEDLVKTPEPLDFEDFEFDDNVVDLRAYSIIGGPFHFKLVHLPPQPKYVNNLIIVRVEEPPVMEDLEYICDINKDNLIDKQSDDTKDVRSDRDKDEKKREEKPPITLSLKLPTDVCVLDEPIIARWIESDRQWITSGFIDASYNEEHHVITFGTPYFGLFGLFQDTYINMPFQSWEIRPRDIDHVLFTIIAAVSEITIEIKGSSCCLHVGEVAQLAHLKDKWMSPVALIKAMKRVGINLFPEPDSAKYVSVQEKNCIAEERLYAQMALTSSSMAYTWSRWNSACEDKQSIVIQAAESLHDEPIREEDWSLYLVTRKRVTSLKMTEFDETFSDDFAGGSNFHADMYHMVLETVSVGAMERIHNTNAAFVDCVNYLLQTTKPITYS